MRECEPIVESFPSIKLDEHMFDALEGVAQHIENEEDRNLLEDAIKRCKMGSFEYAEETLDLMLGEAKPKEEKKQEDMTESEKHWAILGGKEEKPSHEIISYINTLGLLMNRLRIPKEGWPVYKPDQSLGAFKNIEDLRRIALRYAFGEALQYEKLVKEKHIDKEEALKELGLGGVVDPNFIEQRVVRKFDRLPVDLREHIGE